MTLLTLVACVPVPILTPPATFDVGPVASIPPEGPVTSQARIVASLRPLGVVEPLQGRKLDPQTGVIIDLRGDQTPTFGVTTGVDYRAWLTSSGAGWRSVVGPTFAVDVLVEPLRDGVLLSPGVRAGLRWDLLVWMHQAGWSTSSYNPGIGAAHGESGFGAWLDAGPRLYPDGLGWQLSAGVTVRTPAAAGAVVFPAR